MIYRIDPAHARALISAIQGYGTATYTNALPVRADPNRTFTRLFVGTDKWNLSVPAERHDGPGPRAHVTCFSHFRSAVKGGYTVFESPDFSAADPDDKLVGCAQLPDLADAIRACATFMGKDDIRIYLNAMFIQIGLNGLPQSVATDGHRLVVYPMSRSTLPGTVCFSNAVTDMITRKACDGIRGVLIGRGTIEAIRKTIAPKNCDAVLIKGKDRNFSIEYQSKAGARYTIKSRLVDKDFPDYRLVQGSLGRIDTQDHPFFLPVDAIRQRIKESDSHVIELRVCENGILRGDCETVPHWSAKYQSKYLLEAMRSFGKCKTINAVMRIERPAKGAYPRKMLDLVDGDHRHTIMNHK